MTQEHEPDWMRDKRLRDEEARMVQLESNVSAIRAQTNAIKELFEEERRTRRKQDERLDEHEKADTANFTSIDSRLQGMQTQLSSIVTTSERIERKVDNHEPRLKELEDAQTGSTAVARFAKNAWVQFVAGAGLASTLIGIYVVLA